MDTRDLKKVIVIHIAGVLTSRGRRHTTFSKKRKKREKFWLRQAKKPRVVLLKFWLRRAKKPHVVCIDLSLAYSHDLF